MRGAFQSRLEQAGVDERQLLWGIPSLLDKRVDHWGPALKLVAIVKIEPFNRRTPRFPQLWENVPVRGSFGPKVPYLGLALFVDD